MNVMTLRAPVIARDDEMQANKKATKGRDAVECRTPPEVIEGLPRRGRGRRRRRASVGMAAGNRVKYVTRLA